MTEEMFKQYFSNFRYQDGKVLIGEDRFCIMNADYLTRLQQRMEEVIGADGTYAIMYEAAFQSGQHVSESYASKDDQPETSAVNLLAQGMKDLPLEQKLQMFLGFASLSGMGRFHPIGIQETPFLLKAKIENSYVKGLWNGASEGKCNLITFTLAAFIQSLMKVGGTDVELEIEEDKCVAKGDPHCEFTFRQKTE